MTDSRLGRTKSARSAPLALRPSWYIRFRPAIEFSIVIAVSLRCANYALAAAHRHQISVFVFLLVLVIALGVICFGIYRLSTAYRRSQSLLLDAQGITLRHGRVDQRCEWREVTALRRTDEPMPSGAVTSRLYIERGIAPAIALNDDWTIPHIGLIQRLSERQQTATGKTVPIYGGA
jgi:hypothetical protein